MYMLFWLHLLLISKNFHCPILVCFSWVWQVVEEGDMPEEGFCIRSVIAVVVKTPPLEMVWLFSFKFLLGAVWFLWLLTRNALSWINNFIKQDGQLLTLWKRKNIVIMIQDLGEVTFFSSNHSLGIIHTAMCLEPALIIVPTINLGNGEPRISF